MVSKREIKWINALKNKKYRYMHRAYIAEGPKLVNDLLSGHQKALRVLVSGSFDPIVPLEEAVVSRVTEKELKSVSAMVRPNQVLAVFSMHDQERPSAHPGGEWGFAFDHIQDPGNLGTILRTLDWLGIKNVYCSSDCVDIYNPKVVQASMGSVCRMEVRITDLSEYLGIQEVPIYLADSAGESIIGRPLTPGIVVMGNEGRGISPGISAMVSSKIGIPRLGGGESLNVAAATAIIGAWLKLGAPGT